ncbi:SAM-dependent methyltransferase [Anaerosphaera multitolerans]|uniref:Class I SAM-dependent methyltransferase n=1 Tax=Anaerosphaera multitolerans TaxID=2487351 RepID=A0A437S5E8_9FIRM|nr:cyclopropane-fatty-acyl-phospholipid synthase family protein [Anaerosphaera multitolerans]RVU54197.1 class I SAM-dependent methyltransferase [Anaerosphaera multitolerans]
MSILKTALKTIFQRSFKEPIKIIFWDGDSIQFNGEEPKYVVTFNKSISEELLSEDPTLALAEAYMDGDIDIQGDIKDLIISLYSTKDSFIKVKSGILAGLVSKRNNKKDSIENAQYHYDIGNDFYSLWLDESMMYSCAYFKSDEDNLKVAQENKIDYILKKLWIKPGQKLLDIGCGWGELIIKAAKSYGAKSYGITLSEEQYKTINKKIKKENLENQVFVKLMDYRDLKNETFDRVLSIGMLEHVGEGNLPDYFKKVYELLVDGGISLVHSITMPNDGANNIFLNKYIFPGGYVPGVKQIITEIAERGFNLLDVESLRRHYGKTLEMWYENFKSNLYTIRQTKDERFIRMWTLFLQGCAGSFYSGNIDLHQVLFSKGINDNIPWTREYIYN